MPGPCASWLGGRLNEAADRSNRPCPGYAVAVMDNAHVTLVSLTVNGEPRAVMAGNRLSLLDLLRERLGLTGTKKGCDHGQCGACTVLADGRRVRDLPITPAKLLSEEPHIVPGGRRGADGNRE